MQKDMATGVGKALAEGLNTMNNDQTKGLMVLVKRQVEEIDRRGQLVMRMEDSMKLQQENIERLMTQNRHLESLVETLRQEREKLVEELELLKSKSKITRVAKNSKKEDVVSAV